MTLQYKKNYQISTKNLNFLNNFFYLRFLDFKQLHVIKIDTQ
jgi:hypothetical protein